ncbi:zinc-binding alcohol dehydrogenase family protein [Aspergillus lucknowensis]|uniref:GroES-like protein n=1 Tax=Aspergillus lucknowensis TaxID=176173 RepID=A0ABR4LHU6_9EURO
MPENKAAWLTAAKAYPLEVRDAPYTPPTAHEIVVRNRALAINPVDWAKQALGNLLLGHIKYPFILGNDVAGEVVEVGSAVTRFQVGDRVIGQALAVTPQSNRSAEGAFQLYTVLREHLVAKIPDAVTFQDAAVLPLAISTAAYGLFHSRFLGLDLPTVPGREVNDASPVVLITGGASSVGTCAVQLAVAAGYRVLSTASPKNHEYVRGLGAAEVFDYNSPALTRDLVAACKGRKVAGAYAIGVGSVETSFAVLSQVDDCANRYIAYASPPSPRPLPTGALGTISMVGGMVWWMAATAVRSAVKRIKAEFIDGDEWVKPDGEIMRVWRDFVPQALENGLLKTKPEALVVSTRGLEGIQEGMDLQKKGVSARKVVVVL